jgi:hypothetical protein
MCEPAAAAVTEVLRAAQAGDKAAAAELLPLLYAELHPLARARMARLPPAYAASGFAPAVTLLQRASGPERGSQSPYGS